MARLAPVLHVGDLPLAELWAARLDGELVSVDDAFCPIDVPIGPEQRAAAVRSLWPNRLIAEQRTAAWIWGAITDPPAPHQVCSSTLARARANRPPRPGAPPAPHARARAREVVIEADEIAVVGSVRLTTPLRTLVDLARFSRSVGHTEFAAMANLARLSGATLDDCRSALDRRSNLPGKRLAWARLRTAVDAAKQL